jgi:hypothetical protein
MVKPVQPPISIEGGKKCNDGEIWRAAYTRHTKHGEVKVKGNCIIDRGAPGKGPKTLPTIEPKYHLSDYGYSVHKSERSRRSALKKAMEVHGIRDVGRHLNYYRNLQSVKENKDIMSNDVKYISGVYKIYKQMVRMHP